MTTTLPDPVTGELVQMAPLTHDEAEMLTAKIAGHVDQAWRLLVIAYERKAHKALGFASWEAYVDERFSISRQRAYQLIDHGYVLREIEAAVGTVTQVEGDLSTAVDTFGLTERDTRGIDVDEVTSEITERLEQEPDAEPAEVVKEAVKKARKKKADPPADETEDPAEQQRRAQVALVKAWDAAEKKLREGLLAMSPIDCLRGADPDRRRRASQLREDLRKFANAIEAAVR